MLRRFRPYLLHISLALYCPICLFVDSHLNSIPQQSALGLVTFAALLLATRSSPVFERRQVWLCVLVATCYEIWGSIIWGVYRYRFHNLPLFVPPGHGMVYLFGLSAVRTPLFKAYGMEIARLALAGAAAWAVAGVTVLPMVTGRYDMVGLGLLPLFAWFTLRSPRAPIFAAIFMATTGLELFGTNFGNWMWLNHVPVLGIGCGNPPSVIAGGYCVIDGTVMLAAKYLPRLPALSRLSLQPAAAESAA